MLLTEAIETVRDRHLMAVLEESEVTELQALKTKKFLNENLNIIKKVLVEEGVLDGARQHLANNWGKYAAGAGAVGAGVAAYNHFGGPVEGVSVADEQLAKMDNAQAVANATKAENQKAYVDAIMNNMTPEERVKYANEIGAGYTTVGGSDSVPGGHVKGTLFAANTDNNSGETTTRADVLNDYTRAVENMSPEEQAKYSNEIGIGYNGIVQNAKAVTQPTTLSKLNGAIPGM